MSASMNEIEDFLSGPLISWMRTCLPRPEIFTGYQSLLDGTIFHVIWRQIDPEPQYHPVKLTNVDDAALPNARAKNFDFIVRNLKTLYEEELNQTMLIIPDCLVLGHDAESREGLEQMKLLLILLLGAAVQCPNQEIFITAIKELDEELQYQIVELIKQVRDTQSLVLNVDSIDKMPVESMYNHVIRIAKERDKYHSNWITSLNSNEPSEPKSVNNSSALSTSTSTAADQNHFAVELADLKAKIRKYRQDLEEKTEAYIEAKEELEHKVIQYEKLRVESQEWYTESRRAAAYRDEVDIYRERAERADRLEIEVQRFREKLSDAEFFRTRVEELREDNRILLETKEMLEDQLVRSRKRSEHLMALESEIIKYKQKLNDMALERDVDKTKLQELLDENTHLQLATKSFGSAADAEKLEFENDDECASGDNSLSEQLTTNAQTRAIKLELENRRLQHALDSMCESSFHESANKILELEKEKKKLSLKVDQLQENLSRFTQQNQELEVMFKNALEENKKLQDSMDNRQQANDRQLHEREVDRMKLIDLEKHIEMLTKEKQRIQTLSESIQRRADDLERSLDGKTKEVEAMQPKVRACERFETEVVDLKNRINLMERENGNLAKDILKFKQTIEEKDVVLDGNATKIAAQLNEILNLQRQLGAANNDNSKLQEIECKNNEFVSQCKIHVETISTLQKDLIETTLALDRVKKELEKLGVDMNDLSVESVAEKLIKNPDSFKIIRDVLLNYGRELATTDDAYNTCILCQKNTEKDVELSAEGEVDLVNQTEEVLSSVSAQWKEQCDQLAAANAELQATNEQLQSENAHQRVDVSTLGSQITSLNTQHVALQLANSQLASEKDVLAKMIDSLKEKHDGLLADHLTIQALHEQLSSEYDGLNQEKELLKSTLRDLRTENRDFREREASFVKQIDDLRATIEAKKKEQETFTNLRTEHSKLKDDFRHLFTANDRVKSEYKNIQEQYKLIRSENARLNLHNTELSGELNVRTEQTKGLEIELTKLSNRCELLLQMNANLDVDRKALMDHVSQLLSQYHELLAHSLDDKQHYHDEEKLFTDKVNNLYRQKEKLEEKIMEFYRKSESVQKKKTFGSSFVKRVKKASSDLINIVPSRHSRSYIDESRLSQSQFNLGGGSESGGNESDNSIDEPASTASDTNLIKKNIAQIKPTLPRKPDRADVSLLNRSSVTPRPGYQPLIREDSVRSHRNNIHGLEPPDVTGSSLTLGTAGSRRTVYLIDEKLPDSTQPAEAAAAPPTNNSHAHPDPAPSTLLMYNRISNVIGTIGNETTTGAALCNDDNAPDKNLAKDKKKNEERENAIWYEYGCV